MVNVFLNFIQVNFITDKDNIEKKKQGILQEIAERNKARHLKTNDQYRPKPPENAPPQKYLAPLGVAVPTPQSQEMLERKAEILREDAEEKARIESLTKAGGLTQEFDRNR